LPWYIECLLVSINPWVVLQAKHRSILTQLCGSSLFQLARTQDWLLEVSRHLIYYFLLIVILKHSALIFLSDWIFSHKTQIHHSKGGIFKDGYQPGLPECSPLWLSILRVSC
jgi:hypothetical protein